jgi:hypothetical protein
MVFKSLGCLAKEENGYKVFACLILNIVTKAASTFLFQLYFAVTTFFSIHGYRNTFLKSQADLGTIFRVKCGYLKAGTYFLKRVTGRIFKEAGRNLNILNFFHKKEAKYFWKTISAHTKSTDLTFWTPQKKYSSRDAISLILHFNLRKFVDRKPSPLTLLPAYKIFRKPLKYLVWRAKARGDFLIAVLHTHKIIKRKNGK